jgi:hypothetical protein
VRTVARCTDINQLRYNDNPDYSHPGSQAIKICGPGSTPEEAALCDFQNEFKYDLLLKYCVRSSINMSYVVMKKGARASGV